MSLSFNTRRLNTLQYKILADLFPENFDDAIRLNGDVVTRQVGTGSGNLVQVGSNGKISPNLLSIPITVVIDGEEIGDQGEPVQLTDQNTIQDFLNDQIGSPTNRDIAIVKNVLDSSNNSVDGTYIYNENKETWKLLSKEVEATTVSNEYKSKWSINNNTATLNGGENIDMQESSIDNVNKLSVKEIVIPDDDDNDAIKIDNDGIEMNDRTITGLKTEDDGDDNDAVNRKYVNDAISGITVGGASNWEEDNNDNLQPINSKGLNMNNQDITNVNEVTTNRVTGLESPRSDSDGETDAVNRKYVDEQTLWEVQSNGDDTVELSSPKNVDVKEQNITNVSQINMTTDNDDNAAGVITNLTTNAENPKDAANVEYVDGKVEELINKFDNVLYVSQDSGDDENDGTSINRPLATINDAIIAINNTNNDEDYLIVVLDNKTYTLPNNNIIPENVTIMAKHATIDSELVLSNNSHVTINKHEVTVSASLATNTMLINNGDNTSYTVNVMSSESIQGITHVENYIEDTTFNMSFNKCIIGENNTFYDTEIELIGGNYTNEAGNEETLAEFNNSTSIELQTDGSNSSVLEEEYKITYTDDSVNRITRYTLSREEPGNNVPEAWTLVAIDSSGNEPEKELDSVDSSESDWGSDFVKTFEIDSDKTDVENYDTFQLRITELTGTSGSDDNQITMELETFILYDDVAASGNIKGNTLELRNNSTGFNLATPNSDPLLVNISQAIEDVSDNEENNMLVRLTNGANLNYTGSYANVTNLYFVSFDSTLVWNVPQTGDLDNNRFGEVEFDLQNTAKITPGLKELGTDELDNDNNYTIKAEDKGTILLVTRNTTIIIPEDNDMFSLGTLITVLNGTNKVTINGEDDVKVNGIGSVEITDGAQYQGISIIKVSDDNWHVIGAVQ